MLKRFTLNGLYLSVILLITLHMMNMLPGDGDRLTCYYDATKDWEDGNIIEAAQQFSDLGWFKSSRGNRKRVLGLFYERGTKYLKEGWTFDATM